MKYIITESQLESIKDKILKIPFSAFDNDWDSLQEYLKRKGNRPYILRGNVDLSRSEEITTLGSLISVDGDLNLEGSSIQSLGNLTSVGGNLDLYGTSIQSLGNLTLVGGDLDLRRTQIESLGNLTAVRHDLNLRGTPMSRGYTARQIIDMVLVGGDIHL